MEGNAQAAITECPLQVGDKIWRPVREEQDGTLAMLDVPRGSGGDAFIGSMEPAKGGGFLFRATTDYESRGMSDSLWVAVGSNWRGVVCFVYLDVPPAWTYFRVAKVSKNGRSVVVVPVAGEQGDLFDQFDPEIPSDRRDA